MTRTSPDAPQRKPRGRPPLPAKERGSVRSVVCLTAAEVAERSAAARLAPAVYMRRRALARPVRRLWTAEFRELNRIGVNLNQIARALNAGAAAPSGTRASSGATRPSGSFCGARRGPRDAQVAPIGWSFRGVTAYVMHDAPEPGLEAKPTTRERVEWTDVQNLASDRPDNAWRIMTATAKAAPELKRLAGVHGAGRKATKPVYHYSLSWKPGETPDRAEMRRAVDESPKKLGMGDRQALVVPHNDTPHRHVHVIVKRVDPETGRTANIGNDRLKLANWAERWERERGELQCPARAGPPPGVDAGVWREAEDGAWSYAVTRHVKFP